MGVASALPVRPLWAYNLPMSKVSGPKKIGRPRKDSEQVRSRMERPLLDQIDAWAAAQPDQPERAEAVRRLVVLGLGR